MDQLVNHQGGVTAEAALLAAVAEGDFTLAEMARADVVRMRELVEQYADLDVGATDASLVAVAERLGITEVATFDRRHFTEMRPRHVAALDLLPH